MSWFQNILRRLLGIQKRDTDKPTTKVSASVEKPAKDISKPTITVDGRKIFENIDPTVKQLLNEMGQARWESDFRYEAQPESLTWSIWKTDINTFITEFWSIRIFSKLAQFKIRCANNTFISSDFSEDELRQALAKAVEVGPARIRQRLESMVFWD